MDDLLKILEGNADEVRAAVAKLEDLDSVQALIDAEGASEGKSRSTVLAALEKRAGALAEASGGSAELAAVAVDVDGFWPQVLQGDLPTVRRHVETCTNENDLDLVEKLETAGRKRAGVFMVVAQRRRALEPKAKARGKVKPPVWLDDDGKARCLTGVRLVGDLVPYPERGYAAQVYQAELDGHTGVFKAHLSLVNGMPIGGTMGTYLERIYADGE